MAIIVIIILIYKSKKRFSTRKFNKFSNFENMHIYYAISLYCSNSRSKMDSYKLSYFSLIILIIYSNYII